MTAHDGAPTPGIPAMLPAPQTASTTPPQPLRVTSLRSAPIAADRASVSDLTAITNTAHGGQPRSPSSGRVPALSAGEADFIRRAEQLGMFGDDAGPVLSDQAPSTQQSSLVEHLRHEAGAARTLTDFMACIGRPAGPDGQATGLHALTCHEQRCHVSLLCNVLQSLPAPCDARDAYEGTFPLSLGGVSAVLPGHGSQTSSANTLEGLPDSVRVPLALTLLIRADAWVAMQAAQQDQGHSPQAEELTRGLAYDLRQPIGEMKSESGALILRNIMSHLGLQMNPHYVLDRKGNPFLLTRYSPVLVNKINEILGSSVSWRFFVDSLVEQMLHEPDGHARTLVPTGPFSAAECRSIVHATLDATVGHGYPFPDAAVLKNWFGIDESKYPFLERIIQSSNSEL